MSTQSDIRAYFFYASWCGPCKRVKPTWETLKMVYLTNGITCFEYDYDASPTKALMDNLNIKTVPTLVVCRIPEQNEEHDVSGYEELYRGDSKTIPLTAAGVVHTFSIDEDF